ncbi:MAG TPA: aminotransferase class I/II-fold pyridoxal phosphate-dependent enzyme, partial [Candidatus Acidoferrum sp.]|nr:aminotransferase class I/II-fold pyridoxal phosphate-dependent enzyme [Candidatus Acidoferrum sp.]
MPSLDDVLGEELGRLDAAGLRRTLRRWEGAQGPWIELDGRRLASFSSNNYLGLAGHAALTGAAQAVLARAGVGSGASRLIAGNHAEHQALEEGLARFHEVEDGLLFNSGFQANVGVIPALVGRDDLVLSDRLNHASLIDGCRLSRARVLVYEHGDAGHARRLLAAARPASRH